MPNGVIETSTGDLLRWGYCDFLNDGSFDGATETHKTDVPEGSVARKANISFTNWNGSAWVTKTSLSQTKQARIKEIDAKSIQLMQSGFEYPAASGKFFSMSIKGQAKLHGFNEIEAGDFPHSVSAIDDTVHVLANNGAANQMFKAMVKRLNKGILGPGSDLKQNVLNAVDQAALDLIVDNRT